MPLLDRLSNFDGEKLPVHQFYASLFELARGEVTLQNIIDFWSLDAGEQAELQWLITQYQAASNKQAYLERVHCVFLLAEIGVPGYGSQTELQAKLTA